MTHDIGDVMCSGSCLCQNNEAHELKIPLSDVAALPDTVWQTFAATACQNLRAKSEI